MCINCCGNFSHEAMADLIALMNSLVDARGKILVPGVYESVKKLTEEEMALYESIDFDLVCSQTWRGCPCHIMGWHDAVRK